jgi:hypothetical protein
MKETKPKEHHTERKLLLSLLPTTHNEKSISYNVSFVPYTSNKYNKTKTKIIPRAEVGCL